MDKPTFEEVVRRYGAWMRKVLSTFGVRRGDLDDVLQEVLCGVAHGLRAFDPSRAVEPSGALGAWLFVICKRHASHHHREKRRRREAVRETGELDGLDGGLPSPEDNLLLREHAARLQAVLDEMEPDRSAILIAHALGGAGMVDVAAACGIPVNTAWNRLRLAREDARAAIDRKERGRGGTPGRRPARRGRQEAAR